MPFLPRFWLSAISISWKRRLPNFKEKAKTVTERSISIEDLGVYKCPAIVICPNPACKPSISDLHGFEYPTRDLFNMRTPFSEKYKDLFTKTPVRSLFDALSYAEDLEFKYFSILNRDSFLNRSVLNWDLSVLALKVNVVLTLRSAPVNLSDFSSMPFQPLRFDKKYLQHFHDFLTKFLLSYGST